MLKLQSTFWVFISCFLKKVFPPLESVQWQCLIHCISDVPAECHCGCLLLSPEFPSWLCSFWPHEPTVIEAGSGYLQMPFHLEEWFPESLWYRIMLPCNISGISDNYSSREQLIDHFTPIIMRARLLFIIFISLYRLPKKKVKFWYLIVLKINIFPQRFRH